MRAPCLFGWGKHKIEKSLKAGESENLVLRLLHPYGPMMKIDPSGYKLNITHPVKHRFQRTK